MQVILPSGTASSICMSDIIEEVPLLETPRVQNTNRVIFEFTIRKPNFYFQSDNKQNTSNQQQTMEHFH